MIAALSLAVLAATAQVPARQSRVDFVAALAQVEGGWTKPQVEELLGKPDDIWPTNDSPLFTQMGRETWCYGSKGHHSLPTLGRVVFAKDVVSHTVGGYGTPPPASLIDEGALDAALRSLHRVQEPGWDTKDDSAHLLRASNILIGLGEAKALPVLREYCRIGGRGFSDDDWLFWVVRVAFELKPGQKGFRPPGLGAMMPPPPADISKWPTYPILIVDDYPANFYRGAMLAGASEQFSHYLDRESGNWRLRSKPLTPPDDPFALREKIMASPVWATMQEKPKDQNSLASMYTLGLGEICEAMVSGVRSAYRPDGDSSRYYEMTEERYEKLHSEFLALNCRWDPKRNCYVRGDGTMLHTEIIAYPTMSHVFRGIPRLDLEVELSRYEAKNVSISCSIQEKGSEPMAPSAIEVIDEATKKQIFWTRLVGDDKEIEEDMDAYFDRTLEQFLTQPPHKPMEGGGMGMSTGFPLPHGTKIRLVVRLDGKCYESPILAP